MPPLHKRGFALFFTGLSGGGKTTTAHAVIQRLNGTRSHVRGLPHAMTSVARHPTCASCLTRCRPDADTTHHVFGWRCCSHALVKGSGFQHL
ncbi:adenylyl-sulfate kinase [archaeon]|nr:MAG: adenylyl-sulfate kinase [archaeon]